jgi:hypothetical protein
MQESLRVGKRCTRGKRVCEQLEKARDKICGKLSNIPLLREEKDPETSFFLFPVYLHVKGGVGEEGVSI